MKKVLPILLTVALILSLTPYGTSNVFAADITEPIEVTSGETVLPDGDNVVINGKNQAVSFNVKDGAEASLIVNGDISLIGPAESSSNKNGYAVNAEIENSSASLQVSGDISCTGYKHANGIFLRETFDSEKRIATVDIGGNVSAEADRNIEYNEAYGVSATTYKSTISIGGNVSVSSRTAYGLSFLSDGKMTIGGSVTADSNRYDSDDNIIDSGNRADGVYILSGGDTTVDIKEGIYSTGYYAVGTSLYLDSEDKRGKLDFNVGKDIIVKSNTTDDSDAGFSFGINLYEQDCGDINADVKGDIIVSGTSPKASSVAINFTSWDNISVHDPIPGPYNNNVHVHGDVISDDVGINLCTTGELISNVLIEGTLNAANKCVEFDKNAETHITAWKMIPNERGHLVELTEESGNAQYEELEKNLNYIIRKEQPSAGGTFTVVKADGTALDKVEDFEVAHEGEKVYIKPENPEDYILKAAYNGEGNSKTELSKDDGGYYIVVPKGGGVTLSVDIEEAPKPTPTPEPSSTPEVTSSPSATPTPDGNGGNGNDNQDGQDKSDDITKEIPFAENIPVEEKQTVIENTNTDKTDVAGSTMKYLGLKAAKVKKNSIKLSWKKVKGADGYIIYGNKCGNKMKYITTINKGTVTSYTAKKLKKGTYYKYMVVAYKTTASGDKVITTSKSVHAATDGGKKGNPTSIKVKKSKVSLKKGKTAKIKASYKSKKKVATHIAKFRYESLDESIATVSKSGKIKGVGKGTTKVLVYTQNGLSKTIKVTVK